MGLHHVHVDQTLLLLPVTNGHAGSGMQAESAVMPGQEFFDEPVVYFAFTLEHGQDLGTKDLFQLFEVSLRQAQDMLSGRQ